MINNLLKFIITQLHLFSDDVTANTASAHMWCSDVQIGHFVIGDDGECLVNEQRDVR